MDQNQHSMITRARTNSLKPKLYQTNVSPNLNIKPNTYSQANKNICWQYVMKEVNDTRLYFDTIERYKAQLLAKRFSKEVGVDYFDTSSPVIKLTAIRLVIPLTLSQGWRIRQLYINNDNVFPNGDPS